MKKIVSKMKQFVAKKKAPIIGAGALVVLGATQSQAALSTEAQAMVDAVTAAFGDLVGAVSSGNCKYQCCNCYCRCCAGYRLRIPRRSWLILFEVSISLLSSRVMGGTLSLLGEILCMT